MRVGGAHGIAGDAFGSDLLAAAAFDGVIQAQDDDTPGDEHGSQEPEQQPTGFKRRPDRAIQDTMIRLKVGRCTASHNLENRRHCSFPRSKDGTGHKDFHVLPNRSGKDGGKDSNDTGEGDRQGEHGPPFSLKRTWVSLPINFDANCDKWIKSSSQDSQGRKLLPLVSIVANLSITEVEGHHLFLSHSGAGAGGVLTTTNL